MDYFAKALPRIPSRDPNQSVNPLTLLGSLSALQWGFFMVGFAAWACDALDFFAVSLSVTRLAKEYNVTTAQITTSITLTLLFRTVGAIIFGTISDRFGRKYPLVVNLILVAVLSLATSYAPNFKTFLAIRSLFGITMGGIWGLSISNALENMPYQVRGLASGVLQQGYAVGYLVAAVINLTAVAALDRWQILFQIAAALSLATAGFRLVLPESTYFRERQAGEIASGTQVSSTQKSKIFLHEAGQAFKRHWVLIIYAVILMTAFNFFSHGSQDLFPTILQKSKGLSAKQATVITIIGNCGAISGGTVAGYVSQFLGRRLTIISCCVWTLCFLPLWLIPNQFSSLAAGAFFLQAGVQGAWGVIPTHLSEISPVAFRATFPGVVYQLGNMISSSSAQIEATAGLEYTLPNGQPDYGKVSTILIGVVAGAMILLCLFGPESHAAQYEHGKAAFETGAGNDVLAQEEHVAAHDSEKAENSFIESASDEKHEKH